MHNKLQLETLLQRIYYRLMSVQGMVLSHAHSKTGGHGQPENCLVNVHNQVVGRIVQSKLQAWKLFWK